MAKEKNEKNVGTDTVLYGCPNCLTNFWGDKFILNPFHPRYCPNCGYDSYPDVPCIPLEAKKPEKVEPDDKGKRGGFSVGGYDMT